MGGATLLLPLLDHSSALKFGRRHLVESSQECGLHAGEPFERRAVVGSESSTLVAAAGKSTESTVSVVTLPGGTVTIRVVKEQGSGGDRLGASSAKLRQNSCHFIPRN